MGVALTLRSVHIVMCGRDVTVWGSRSNHTQRVRVRTRLKMGCRGVGVWGTTYDSFNDDTSYLLLRELHNGQGEGCRPGVQSLRRLNT